MIFIHSQNQVMCRARFLPNKELKWINEYRYNSTQARGKLPASLLLLVKFCFLASEYPVVESQHQTFRAYQEHNG